MDTEAQIRFKKYQKQAEKLLAAISRKIKIEERERNALKDQTSWEGVADMAKYVSDLMDIAEFMNIPGARQS